LGYCTGHGRNPHARYDTREKSLFCPEAENNFTDNAGFDEKLAQAFGVRVGFFFSLSDKSLPETA
jgi:hypothetical protein